MANEVSSYLKDLDLNDDDLVEILQLSIKQLGIYDKLKFDRKPTKTGRKSIVFDTQLAVWNYWHENATTSTLTSRPAKLKVDDRNKVQDGLHFITPVSIITL